jgi:hypothetical protein
VDVRRLDGNPPGPAEPIEDELAGTAQEAGLEAIDNLLHPDRPVAIDPAARLDIDRLARLEHLLEDVAVAVHPDDPFVALGLESVDEEAGPAEQHVRDALDPVERVVDVGRRGKELVLPDEDVLAGRQVE